MTRRIIVPGFVSAISLAAADCLRAVVKGISPCDLSVLWRSEDEKAALVHSADNWSYIPALLQQLSNPRLHNVKFRTLQHWLHP
jgi:hypothetical protein